MKVSGLNTLLMSVALMLYATSSYSHTGGEHSGGILQQLMHILQSVDHLFIILTLVVVAVLLAHQFVKSRH